MSIPPAPPPTSFLTFLISKMGENVRDMQSLEHLKTYYFVSASHTLSTVYPVLPYNSAVTLL